MNPERWRLMDELFGRALQLPLSERQAFVEQHAGADPDLEAQLLSMLRSDQQSSYMDDGVASVSQELLNETFLNSFGPYRPKRALGEGGMGVVYLAQHAEWGTLVAIKIPRHAWISPDRKERFAAEQRVLAQLTHPAIARIYEGGTGLDSTPWFAMEYVQGESITTFASNRSLTIVERLQLFRQACEAVQYAHSQAIIHRDLKPSNILVTPAGQVKLLDFGIAKQMDETNPYVTRTGAQPLTVAYAAPEQVAANKISVQSDIYSLGVILYELLTCRLPFDVTGLTPLQAEQLISTKAVERPSTLSSLRLNRSEWTDLDVLVLKSIHKDVAQRYTSVDALIRDVDHFLRAEPLEARPDGFRYRTFKFLQRRKLPVALSLAAAVGIASLIWFFTWRLARSRDVALLQARRERQIQQFMTDLFEGGDQVNGPSKDTRVVDMLEAGIEKARQFDKEPLIQGDLYNTLGTVEESVGEWGKADSLFHLALVRFEAIAGPQSKDAAQTLVNIGQLRHEQGKYPLAESTIQKAIDIEANLQPAEPILLARYRLVLAGVLSDEVRYSEALEMLKSAGQVQSKSPDGEDDWLANLNLQSVVNIQLHRYPEAERVTRHLIEIDRKRHPVLRPEDANDVFNLGQIEEAQYRFDKAEQSYRQALQIEESWFPDGHPEVANGKRLLAQALQKQGKNEQAAPLARQSLAELQHIYGPSHRRVAYALRLLYSLAFARHDFKEARADAEREIAIYKRIDNTADLPMALSNLADVDAAEKNYRGAETLYKEAISRFPATEWRSGAGMAHAQLKLGELLVQRMRFGEAQTPLLASLALWKTQPVLLKPRVKETLLALARTYDGLHAPEKASEYRKKLAAFPK